MRKKTAWKHHLLSLRGRFKCVMFEHGLLDQFITFMRCIGLNVDEKTLFLVVLEERLRLAVIDAQTVLNTRHRIVVSLREWFPSDVVDTGIFRRAICGVIHSSTWYMSPTI